MIQLTSIRHTWPNPPHFTLNRKNGHNDYTFVHFATSINLHIDGNTLITPDHSCIIYKPGTPQHFSCPDGMIHDWFHFTNLPENFFESLDLPTDILFLPGNWSFITNLVEEIENEFFAKEAYSAELIDIKIKDLFIKISRSLKNKNSDFVNEKITNDFRTLRKTVMQALSHNWTIAEMASMLYLSPSRFSHLYKKFYNTTPIDDLIHARIDYAKNALLLTKQTNEEIAEALGYKNPTHFCRQFRQLVGISPSGYRKEHL